MAGFEPAPSCSQIRSSVLLGGAERGLLCCLAGMMAAGRRPTWPGTGGRWLPTWLPGNLLARLMFDLPNMRANSFAGCLGASSRYRCGSAVVLGWATSCKIVRLWLGSRVGCGPRPRSSYLEEPSGAHRAACDDAVGQGVGHTLWYRGVRVGCGLLLPVESPPHAGLAQPAHQRAAADHAGSPARTAAPAAPA